MPPSGREVKIRASCDSCTESKVRCSQTRPVCNRCAKNNMRCRYGISQRAGRHRATSHNTWLATPDETAMQSPGWDLSAMQQDWTLNSSALPESFFMDERLRSGANDFGGSRQTLFPVPVLNPVDDHITGSAGSRMLSDFMEDNSFFDEICNSTRSNSLFISNTSERKTTEPRLDLEDNFQDPSCPCIYIVVSFLSSHPIFTRKKSFPIDLCLVQGREAANNCERVLTCSKNCLENERSTFALALLIDRIIAIYDNARDDYHTTLSKILRTPNNSISTNVSPTSIGSPIFSGGSPASAHKMSKLGDDKSIDDTTVHFSGEYPGSNLTKETSVTSTIPSSQQHTFIGAYQLDQEDEAMLKFEIVSRHISRIQDLIKAFKSTVLSEGAMSQSQDSVMEDVGGNGRQDQKSERERQVSLRSGLVGLLEQKFGLLHSRWETFFREHNSEAYHGSGKQGS